MNNNRKIGLLNFSLVITIISFILSVFALFVDWYGYYSKLFVISIGIFMLCILSKHKKIISSKKVEKDDFILYSVSFIVSLSFIIFAIVTVSLFLTK